MSTVFVSKMPIQYGCLLIFLLSFEVWGSGKQVGMCRGKEKALASLICYGYTTNTKQEFAANGLIGLQ